MGTAQLPAEVPGKDWTDWSVQKEGCTWLSAPQRAPGSLSPEAEAVPTYFHPKGSTGLGTALQISS